MKILVKIKNDRLCFITRKKLNPDYKNMLNTNVISNNELVFSDEYIFLNQILTYIIVSLFFLYYHTKKFFSNFLFSNFPFLTHFHLLHIFFLFYYIDLSFLAVHRCMDILLFLQLNFYFLFVNFLSLFHQQ